jgi:hypothetical protein
MLMGRLQAMLPPVQAGADVLAGVHPSIESIQSQPPASWLAPGGKTLPSLAI